MSGRIIKKAKLGPPPFDLICEHMDHSPGDDDDKVHDVPHVPEVAARVEHEALRQDLEARLHSEDAQEVRLGRLLHAPAESIEK